jgi:hypothetical protein
MPQGLPAPVERFYRLTYGEQIPVTKTAVMSGRGRIRLGGVAFPMRCRFMHESARNFRSYFEVTLFGQPIMKVNEHYRDGKFRQALPFGVEEGQPKNDHSAALRMWAEWVLWAPAMLLADPDVQWKPVDAGTALLSVPVPTGGTSRREHLVVRFDEATGQVQYAEAMKYKHPTDPTKTLWVNAIWLGDTPWFDFTIEDKVYNAPVDTSLSQAGPSPGNPPP